MATPTRLVVPTGLGRPAQPVRIPDISSLNFGPHFGAYDDYNGRRTFNQGFMTLVSGEKHDLKSGRIGPDEMASALGNLYRFQGDVRAYIAPASRIISFASPRTASSELGTNFIAMPKLDGSKMTAGQMTTELVQFLNYNKIRDIVPASAAILGQRAIQNLGHFHSTSVSPSGQQGRLIPLADNFTRTVHPARGDSFLRVAPMSPRNNIRFDGPEGLQ